jgi:hypothetical protein
MASLQSTIQTGNLTVTSNVNNSNRAFQTFSHSYNSGNSSINVVRAGNGYQHYNFQFQDSSNWPSCTNQYEFVCPIQRNGGRGIAEIDIHGDHRGIGGSSYLEHYRVRFGGGSDSAWIIIYCIANNGSRFRYVRMNANGTLDEFGPFSANTVYTYYYGIGESYTTQPCFFKIFGSCGSNKVWNFYVRTTGMDFGPPYKGPFRLAPNTNPVKASYM